MSKPAGYENLLDRVRARVTKQASTSDQGVAMPKEEDPNASPASAPTDAAVDGNKEKQTVSASKSNKDKGEAGKTLENAEAGTYGSGEGKTKEGQNPAALPTDGDLFSKQAADIITGLKDRMGLKVEKSAAKEEAGSEDEAKKEASKNEEDELPAEFTHEFHVKLASTLLATEAGRDHVRGILSDAMGAEAVDTLIKQASDMETHMQKQAQFEQLVKKAMDEMDPKEREEFIKSAKFHQSEVAKFEYGFEKVAYQQGAMDAAAMAQGGGELPPLPEEGAEPSIEEIVMILDQLVQSGQIDPALAEAILMELTGGGVDPAAAGGGMPPEAAVAEAGPKQASVDSIIDAVVS